jgi:hypothetical protein
MNSVSGGKEVSGDRNQKMLVSSCRFTDSIIPIPENAELRVAGPCSFCYELTPKGVPNVKLIVRTSFCFVLPAYSPYQRTQCYSHKGSLTVDSSHINLLDVATGAHGTLPASP